MAERVRPEQWERFLASLEEGNTPRYAAKEASIHHATAYRRRSDDEEFSKQWESAYRAGTEYLEQIATERALGKSDALLKFLLQSRDPDRFSQRHTLSGPNGGPIQLDQGSDLGL